MRNIITIIIFAAGVLLLAGCVEDAITTDNGYYSRGSGVTTTYNSATVGYNRDYQPSRAPRPGYNGYYSTGSGTSRNYQPPVHQAPQSSTGGWSSAGG